MRFLYPLFFLCSILLTSCQRPVGGPCEFETRIGVAQIVRAEDGKNFASFNPMEGTFTSQRIPFSPEMTFEVHQRFDGGEGSIYPAQLAIMTKGSCTPYNFALLATETTSRGVFLPFDKKGQLAPHTKARVIQLAAVYKKLDSNWPDLSLSLCGQTQRQGTEEYNFNLANHYIKRVTDLLQQNGVDTSRITTIAFADASCSETPPSPEKDKNGVWFNLYLTEKSATAAQDQHDFAQLNKQANHGDKTAQYYLGSFYAGGKGVEQDFSQAFYWFKKAADQGLCEAQLLVGLSYFSGIGTEKNRSEAADWFEKAADAGSADAAYQMGLVYLLGRGREINETKGREYMRDAARQGNHDAIAFFKHAAAQHDTQAQLFLAQLYTYGMGVSQDNEEAMSLYHQAAEAGDSDAMFLLGQAYHDGYITSENPEKALFWYLKAAENGNDRAWYRLGYLYEIGELVPQNRKKAIFWYTKAAAAGYEDADLILDELKQENNSREEN